MSLIIKTYVEVWICDINNLTGFFNFFGSVIGYYGLKFNNKEYLKTVSVTSLYHIVPNDDNCQPAVQLSLDNLLCGAIKTR
jgi:hypothetical protein